MKKLIPVFVLIGLITYVVVNTAFNNEETAADVGLEKGNVAPDFELSTFSGETVKLSDLRGKKVILNFWASWCPPCRAEMPEMQEFHEEYGNEIVILAVNMTSTEVRASDVEEFLNEYGLTFTILMDEKSIVGTDKYQVVTLPTSYFIDTNGKIQEKIIGAMDYKRMLDITSSMD